MKYAELLGGACKQIAAKPTLPFLNRHEPHPQLLRLLAFYSQMPQQKNFAARLQCYQNIPAVAAQLLGRLGQPAPPQIISTFAHAVERCCGGEPLPYILGLAEFSEYIFATGPGALIPREESEVLLEEAFLFCQNRMESRIESIRRQKQHKNKPPQNAKLEIIELCCGTGCIAIRLQQKLGKLAEKSVSTEIPPQIAIWAADISAAALHYARQNAVYWLGKADHKPDELESKFVCSAGISFSLCQSDLFAHKELQRRYDLILANPPYLSGAECERRQDWREPQLALNGGADGLDIFRHIVAQSGRFLKTGGVLVLEAAPWQMHSLQRQLENNGYRQISRRRDGRGLERVISARYTK